MADGAKPQELQLPPNEILGIVQRNLLELNSYISQGPGAVDDKVCQAYLERAWGWVGEFKKWRDAALAAQEAKDGKAPAKKAS